MKKKAQKFKLTPIKLVSIILVSTFMAWLVYSAAAATGSFKLTADKTAVTQGDTLTISLNETSDTPVSVAQAKITFDSSKFTYQGADYTGTPFPTNVPGVTSGAGYVLIGRYLLEGNFPTGTNLVAKLSFKATASSGTSAFAISQPDSVLLEASTGGNVLSTVSGVSVTLQAPTPPSNPAPPSPDPVSPPAPTKATSSTNNTVTSRNTTPTTSSPTTNTNTTVDPSLLNPTNSDVNTYQSNNKIPEPGKSQISPNATLSQRIVIVLKKSIPVIGISAVVGGLAWFAIKKIRERPYGFSAPTPSTAGPGVGTSHVVPKTPAPTVDPTDDHTPRTFSGI